MATIITIEGEELKLKNLSRDALQKAVGGYIEVIRLPDKGRMVINEEGVNLGLAVNNAASLIYGQRVFGDVVLLDKDDKV